MTPNTSNLSLFNKTDFHREMNGSSSTPSRCFANDSATDKVLRVAAYSILIVISLVGNSLVVAVVYRYKKMQTNTNIFIANMAIADLVITTVYMPRLIAMYVIGTTWIEGTLGLILCKIVPFLHGVSLLVSILTLLLISIERLCTIMFPLKYIFNPKRTKIAITIIWMVALLARIPYFLALTTVVSIESGRTACSSKLKRFFGKPEARDIYYLTLLTSFYALPLVLIICSYLVIIINLRKRRAPGSALTSQQLDKRRVKAIRNVARMMIVVTVAFIACWITYFLAQLLFDKVPCALRFWRLFLAHSNSALNPCLYVYFNRKFRRGFVKVIVGIFSSRETGDGMNFTQSEKRKRSAGEKGDGHRNISSTQPNGVMARMDIITSKTPDDANAKGNNNKRL